MMMVVVVDVVIVPVDAPHGNDFLVVVVFFLGFVATEAHFGEGSCACCM